MIPVGESLLGRGQVADHHQVEELRLQGVWTTAAAAAVSLYLGNGVVLDAVDRVEHSVCVLILGSVLAMK